MALEKELAFYAKVRPELIKHHLGKYALIVGESLLGTFDTQEAAYQKGIESHGNVPMLIRRVSEKDATESTPAMTLRLFHVSP